MTVNTRGIVLSSLRYSDSSVIVRIYTECDGLRPFMVRTGKGRAAMFKMSLLQPLTLVELSFDKDDRKGMRTPRSLERDRTLNGIPFDTAKTCIALFMAEVIGRSIGEEESNPVLFGFLRNSIILLDAETEPVLNFHLKFMLEFSRHLGFYPHHRAGVQRHFDLSEGEFTVNEPIHPYVISDRAADQFEALLETAFEDHHTIRLGNETRRLLLQRLVDYFRLHLEGMKEITSHRVLEEVLS